MKKFTDIAETKKAKRADAAKKAAPAKTATAAKTAPAKGKKKKGGLIDALKDWTG